MAGTPARPGRQRNEDTRQAIVAAAARIVERDGYAALSVEGMARESGAGKQTIYRWWPSKADVIMDALLDKLDAQVPVPSTGTLRGDLTEFLTSSLTVVRRGQVRALLAALAAEAQSDPAFAERFRARFVHNRHAALLAILQRPDNPDRPIDGVRAATLADVVFGVTWYRLLISPSPFDAVTVEELLTLLTGRPGETDGTGKAAERPPA